jgi:hypothetical protein
MRHLLNCTECEYSLVVAGPSARADIKRDYHERGYPNWRGDQSEFCPRGSVAWTILPEDANV